MTALKPCPFCGEVPTEGAGQVADRLNMAIKIAIEHARWCGHARDRGLPGEMVAIGCPGLASPRRGAVAVRIAALAAAWMGLICDN